MTTGKTFLVATDGQAVLRTHDDGKTWRRITPDQDLEFDDCVRCLLADPRQPNGVFAGAESGLFHSTDCGTTWNRIDCALNGYSIWKMAVAAKNPDIMYAGTGSPTRSAFFRSTDGGRTWEKTSLIMPPKCEGVSRPRMLAMCIDPDDPADVWVGVEEGGLFHSRDGGSNWTRIDPVWPELRGNSDVHSIVVCPGSPKVVVVVVVGGIYRSTDGGETWQQTVTKEAWGIPYSRVALLRPGSDREILLSIADGTPGTTSRCLRSTDAGATWETMPLPVVPNSCIWAFGANPADSSLILAGTKYGELYRSEDAGQSWAKEWREFSEITDTTWIPAVPADGGSSNHGH